MAAFNPGLLNESLLGAVPRDFVPDVTFTGSALSGWHGLGQAGWRADDGKIIGTPAQTNGGCDAAVTAWDRMLRKLDAAQ